MLPITDEYECKVYNGEKEKIGEFCNSINENIAKYINNFITNEYKNNETKMYFVFDKEKRPLFCFALKCGQMFNMPLDKIAKDDNDKYEELVNKLIEIVPKINDENKDISNSANDELGKIYSSYEDYELVKKAVRLAEEHIDITNRIVYSGKTIGIKNTFSAMELCIFCKNTKYNKEVYAKSSEFFWEFIVPIVIEVSEKVGCKYFYLFAADNGSQKLIDLYTKMMQFSNIDREHNRVLQPFFDKDTVPLYQEVENLKEVKELSKKRTKVRK